VPVTERYVAIPFIGKSWWQKFQFPVGGFLGNHPSRMFKPFTTGDGASFLVLLLHSWSLLYWDRNGYAEYRNDRRLEDFRLLIHRLAKDYDIITTEQFLDLHKSHKITTSQIIDLGKARYMHGAPLNYLSGRK
jgi:hypothetical protein